MPKGGKWLETWKVRKDRKSSLENGVLVVKKADFDAESDGKEPLKKCGKSWKKGRKIK